MWATLPFDVRFSPVVSLAFSVVPDGLTSESLRLFGRPFSRLGRCRQKTADIHDNRASDNWSVRVSLDGSRRVTHIIVDVRQAKSTHIICVSKYYLHRYCIRTNDLFHINYK